MTEFEATQTLHNARVRGRSLRQLRKYGFFTLLSVALLTTILKGMPLQNLWPVLGKPMVLATMLLFARTVGLGGTVLISWWTGRSSEPRESVLLNRNR
jgi:hypothetical protein